MSEKLNPEKYTAEEKKRLGYIEGRPDLFETKLLEIEQEKAGESPEHYRILVVTRDPGSGNALLPVIKELSKDSGASIITMTDGRAEDVIENNFSVQDVTPNGNILTAESVIGNPNVILIDNSEEMGIETYASATFPDVPKVLVEDYYTNSIHFLSELMKRKMPLPEKICVMDQGAKDLITERFPDLKDRIEVTGQPAFDRFFHEDTEKIAQQVRGKLGLKPGDRLVSYMSTMDEPEKITQMADALKGVKKDFYFVFRRHPRDNVKYETYKKMLADAGVKVLDTDEFSTDEIGAASDVVLTTWSTEGLNGIYRRKPTVNIVDPHFAVPENLSLPLVSVKLGASVGANNMAELIQILPQLLKKGSDLNTSLKRNMKKYYLVDGKNSERVAKIVRQVSK